MYAAFVRPDEVVRTPTGRLAVVVDVVGETVEIRCMDNGDVMTLRAKHLQHVSDKWRS